MMSQIVNHRLVFSYFLQSEYTGCWNQAETFEFLRYSRGGRKMYWLFRRLWLLLLFLLR